MMVDDRQPNAYHRLPPHAAMGSVDSIAALVEKIKQRLPEGYGVKASRNLPDITDRLLAAEFSFELEVDGNLILQGPFKD